VQPGIDVTTLLALATATVGSDITTNNKISGLIWLRFIVQA
jgi:hypothetical protein